MITLPRSGSGWVERYVKSYNYANGYREELLSTHFNEGDIYEKYLSLKLMIDNGRYPHFRLHPIGVIRDTDETFYDIIKDYDIVMLSRKDKWRSTLSCLVQYQTKWAFAHNFYKERKEQWDNVIKNGLTIDTENLQQIRPQIAQYEYLESVKDKAYKFLYYEDLSDKELRKHFSCDSYLTPPYSDKNINYEEIIINIKEVKEEYENVLRTI